ncbi:hypothetical protein PV327_003562 [Microctonus hyperodae]|uniref:Cytochrome P450 n=1 Tax=Microctonus hyperodae TaxID=165561 RepID=A0AA39L108_MICHY|nr:hypothetical protein PV327_003562 [Microctonus hyperodae]
MDLMTLILFTIFIVGLITLITYHIKRLNLYRAAAKIPGPPTYPLIGNAHYFIGNTADIINKVMELLSAYPSVIRVWLGNQLFIGITDPELVKKVLLSPKTIEKGDVYRFIRPWLGKGLLVAPAATWRAHRKIITPTFNIRILESFVEIFVEQCEILIKEMEVELEGNEFDVFDYVSRCTLDIVCETAMGVSSKVQTRKNSPYLDAVKTITEILYMRMFKVWLHPDIIFYCTSLAAKQKNCLKYLHGNTDNVIREKRAQLNNSPDLKNTKSSEKEKIQRKAFLDHLMELSDEETKFTDKELREEVNSMMTAGNETTAVIDTFAIFILANFPEVQQKCYDELCEIFGDKVNEPTKITRDDVRRMEYLERVIKETMRLFPVGPILVRNVTDDLDIEKCVLPKGSSVVIPVIKLHRREDIWTNSVEFDPDRFLPDEVAKRHPYSYIPFSAGPRNCIGLQYAMMSMKVLLASVLRKYILYKDSKIQIKDMKLKADMLLKPVNPIKVKIMRRKKIN